jgi:hypothetical protein
LHWGMVQFCFYLSTCVWLMSTSDVVYMGRICIPIIFGILNELLKLDSHKFLSKSVNIFNFVISISALNLNMCFNASHRVQGSVKDIVEWGDCVVVRGSNFISFSSYHHYYV